MIKNVKRIFLLGVLLLLLTACGRAEGEPQSEESTSLEIVITTTFIGDVIQQVAGDIAKITVLLEPGQNPHAYHPTPQDMVNISRADAIFSNGFGLEEFSEIAAGKAQLCALDFVCGEFLECCVGRRQAVLLCIVGGQARIVDPVDQRLHQSLGGEVTGDVVAPLLPQRAQSVRILRARELRAP